MDSVKWPTAYRARAARALGRKLRSDEHVHHHSETQLVICTKEYHRWLHGRMRERGLADPKPSGRKPTLRVSAWAVEELRRRSAVEGRTVVAIMDRLLSGR